MKFQTILRFLHARFIRYGELQHCFEKCWTCHEMFWRGPRSGAEKSQQGAQQWAAVAQNRRLQYGRVHDRALFSDSRPRGKRAGLVHLVRRATARTSSSCWRRPRRTRCVRGRGRPRSPRRSRRLIRRWGSSDPRSGGRRLRTTAWRCSAKMALISNRKKVTVAFIAENERT